MRPKDKKLANIMPIVPVDLPDVKDRADISKSGLKPDSHKVKIGPGSKR